MDIDAALAFIAGLPDCSAACTNDASCGTGYTCQAATTACGCATCVAPPACFAAGHACTANSECCSAACNRKTHVCR